MSKGYVSKTVEVSIEKYNYFVALEARVEALKDFVTKSRFGIDRPDVASIIGFPLPADKADNE